MALQSLKAVSFNFYPTLAEPKMPLAAWWAQCLHQANAVPLPATLPGQPPLQNLLAAGLRQALQSTPRCLPSAPNDSSSTQAYWRNITQAVLTPVCPQPSLVQAVFEATWTAAQKPEFWRPNPLATATLEWLNIQGYRVLLCSNGPAWLEDVVAGLRWQHYFQHLCLAPQMGAYKPTGAFFDTVAKRIGLPADAILHVGSDIAEDYWGAKKAGWTPVWLYPEAVQSPRLQNPELASSREHNLRCIRHLGQLIVLLAKARAGFKLERWSPRLIPMLGSLRNIPSHYTQPSPGSWAQPIDHLLDQLVTQHRLEASVRPEQTLMAHWRELLGPGLAHRCFPERIGPDNTLVLWVTSPVLRQELSFRSAELLERIRALPGCNLIRALKVQVR
jgi:HAD superfamily hydrolase (TIGR01493 family)